MSTPKKAPESGKSNQTNLILGGLALVLIALAAYFFMPTQSANGPDGGVAGGSDVTPGLMDPGPLPENVMGSADAPVTVIEYASMTCSHCADFHNNVLPGLKKKYIDTGKVRYILREFPGERIAYSISALARCLGPDKYFAFVDAVFSTFDNWACRDCDIKAGIMNLWKQAGKTEEDFNACFDPESNKAILDGINEVSARGKTYGVEATPTLFVNGRKLTGGNTLEELEAAIDPLLKG